MILLPLINRLNDMTTLAKRDQSRRRCRWVAKIMRGLAISIAFHERHDGAAIFSSQGPERNAEAASEQYCFCGHRHELNGCLCSVVAEMVIGDADFVGQLQCLARCTEFVGIVRPETFHIATKFPESREDVGL